MKKSFKTSDGVELYVEFIAAQEDEGDTAPIIIWSHGFTGSARNWRSTIRKFPQFAHVIYDLRGHARSGAPEDPAAYTLERFSLDLRELISDFADERQVFAVGLSFGAVISATALLSCSQSVSSQIEFANPNVKLVMSSLPDPTFEKSISGYALLFANAIFEHGLDQAGEQFVWGEGSGLSERDAGLVRQGFLEHSAHGIALILQHAFTQLPSSQEMSAWLASSDVPSMLLYGENDSAAIAYSSRILSELPSSSVVEGVQIEKGGHLLNLTSNAVFCSHIQSFFIQH